MYMEVNYDPVYKPLSKNHYISPLYRVYGLKADLESTSTAEMICQMHCYMNRSSTLCNYSLNMVYHTFI